MTLTARARRNARKAFTLVELVAVMVVLAVLAGVAAPKYFDYADKAKTSALQGALGGVRTGVSNFYTDAAFAGTPKYPVKKDIETVGTVMQDALPKNPFNNLSDVQKITSKADATNRAVSNTDKFGWNYYVDNDATPPVAVFWANSADKTTVKNAAGKQVKAKDL